jgi:hypothetical protein
MCQRRATLHAVAKAAQGRAHRSQRQQRRGDQLLVRLRLRCIQQRAERVQRAGARQRQRRRVVRERGVLLLHGQRRHVARRAHRLARGHAAGGERRHQRRSVQRWGGHGVGSCCACCGV